MRFTERGEGIIPVPAHPLASQTLTSLPIIDHLVEDDSGTRIQNLFVGGSVRLAIEVWILTQALKVQANAEVVWSSLYIGAESLDKGSTFPPPPPLPRVAVAALVVIGRLIARSGASGLCLPGRCKPYGSVPSKPIVLFSEVCRKKEKGRGRRKAKVGVSIVGDVHSRIGLVA